MAPKNREAKRAQILKAWDEHAQKAGDPVTYESAEAMECEECGKKAERHPLVLGSKCHPGAPLMALYFRGLVLLYCALCGDTACTIRVGRELDETQAGERKAATGA